MLVERVAHGQSACRPLSGQRTMPRMRARSADTDPEAERVQIELLRRAGPTRRASMALSLSAQVIGLARRAILRSLPGTSEREVSLLFVERHYGRELGSEVRQYLAARGR
jgi:hypothetical protein